MLFLPKEARYVHNHDVKPGLQVLRFCCNLQTFNLYNATSYSDEVLALRQQKHFPEPSATLFQDALNLTNTLPPQEPKYALSQFQYTPLHDLKSLGLCQTQKLWGFLKCPSVQWQGAGKSVDR